MSDSLFFSCGWPSLGIGLLIAGALALGISGMVKALRRSEGRRGLAALALGFALIPASTGFLAWGLMRSSPASELQGRACAEIGVAGSFFNAWLAIGALLLAFLIPARK
ncbi:MAG: hypothetical protein AB7K71_18055 [Polyangiaceae bacterium]